jgi:hypothetical protein
MPPRRDDQMMQDWSIIRYFNLCMFIYMSNKGRKVLSNDSLLMSILYIYLNTFPPCKVVCEPWLAKVMVVVRMGVRYQAHYVRFPDKIFPMRSIYFTHTPKKCNARVRSIQLVKKDSIELSYQYNGGFTGGGSTPPPSFSPFCPKFTI